MFSGDSNAGIHNRETQPRMVFGQLQAINFQYDLAYLGEFDGVADEVDDDLTNATRVAVQVFRNLFINVECQFQSFGMGAKAQCFHGVAQRFADIEGCYFQFEFAGFDFGEIENVVDQRQQCVAGILHHGQILALSLGQLRLE